MKNITEIITILSSVLFIGYLMYTTDSNYIKVDKEKFEYYVSPNQYLEITGDIEGQEDMIRRQKLEMVVFELKPMESTILKPGEELTYTIDSTNVGGNINNGEIYYSVQEEGVPVSSQQNDIFTGWNWDTLKFSNNYVDSLYFSGLLTDSKCYFRHNVDSMKNIIIGEYLEENYKELTVDLENLKKRIWNHENGFTR